MIKPTLISSRTLVIIIASIAINMIGQKISSILSLPIFLDSVGTLGCALLVGPLAAMFSGLLTNLICSLTSGSAAAAFIPVAMIIGISAGLLARVNGFRSLSHVVISGVLITLALALVAVPIRTYLFYGTTGSGADFLIAYLYAISENLFQSVAITVIGVNLADKILSAIIAWILIRQLPPETQRNFPQMARVR